MYDAVIIGAGVTGCAAARYLSEYEGSFCVIEQEAEVCSQTSKANSAIVHAGYDAGKGTKMAAFNLEGSRMMPGLCEELDIPFLQNGSLVVCFREEDYPGLQKLYQNGIDNGVEGLQLLDRAAVLQLEPQLNPRLYAALYAPTGGIVCPFTLTIALAENACVNGVEFKLSTKVEKIVESEGCWTVITDKGTFQSRCIVNAAGVYADRLHNMVSERKIHITPRRGDYVLLDHSAGDLVKHTIFQLPGAKGKGILLTPTVHGNILAGPTAFDIDDKEGVNTTAEGFSDIFEKMNQLVRDFPSRQIITGFAGLRAHEDGHEFLLGELKDAPGFFDCAGIESPGLTSAPAIGKKTAEWIREKLSLPEKKDFVRQRKGILHPLELSQEEYQKLIEEDPAYGQIICRCERITEGEIRDAVRRPLGARTMDGIKRRVRAGMGRCQGGFCSPRVMEILSEELQIPMEELTKSGGRSRMITGKIKDGIS